MLFFAIIDGMIGLLIIIALFMVIIPIVSILVDLGFFLDALGKKCELYWENKRKEQEKTNKGSGN